uniref:Uncharacterized protein n=1 Tax=Oryza glaberrima TaxID=4538 RepID=I1QWV5_ORYGL
MTNMNMISAIKADEDVGGGKDNDTNQSNGGDVRADEVEVLVMMSVTIIHQTVEKKSMLK